MDYVNIDGKVYINGVLQGGLSATSQKPNGAYIEKDFTNLLKNSIQELSSNTPFDFVIVSEASASDKITIKAFEGQMELIKVLENGGHVSVETQPGSFIFENVQVSIGSKHLDKMNFGGAGNVHAKIFGERLNLKNSGTSNVFLEGKVKALELNNSGTGDVNAQELKAETVVLKNSGTGNMSVQAEKTIEGKNSGTGNVYVDGAAQVQVIDSGIGHTSKKSMPSKANVQQTIQQVRETTNFFGGNFNNLKF